MNNCYLRRVMGVGLLLAFILTGCNFNVDEITPTVEGLEENVNPLPEVEETTPSPSPSLTPAQVVLASSTPTGSPLPPTQTPTFTPTVGPYEHTVQEGENLVGIAGQYRYNELSIIDEILELNGLPSASNIRPGQVIRIPRQTATPTPEGYEATQAYLDERGITTIEDLAAAAITTCHTVQEGETIIEIAELYDTSVALLSQLNPEMDFRTCDFSTRSGGPGCRPPLQQGMCVNVPLPTPTVTPTFTPSGSETPTLTPTSAPPIPLNPPQGGVVTGLLNIEWVSSGVLAPDEAYFVQVFNTASGEEVYQGATRMTSLPLPETLVPSGGEPVAYEWRVSVAVETAPSVYAIISEGQPRTFQWRGR